MHKSMMMTMMTMQAYSAALERIFKVGGTYMSGAKRRKNCLSCHSTFMALQVQSVVLVSASVWSVQLITFLFFFLLALGARAVICKSGGTCPRALYGVSAIFVLQFHTKKHYKTAIISECIVSQGLFSQCLRSKLCTE